MCETMQCLCWVFAIARPNLRFDASQRLPAEHVLRAVEGIKSALERRQHRLGDCLRRPAAVLVGNTEGARLAHEEDLVLADGEDLSCHLPRKVACQEYADGRDLGCLHG